MARNLIMVPYAYVKDMSSGINIKNQNKSFDTYLKACCVALASAKKYNSSSDTHVALVTNIDVPDTYKKVLDAHNIHIFNIPFDTFQFASDYRWAAAFYKLCALYHIARETSYENYCYIDTDVYVQGAFDNIWRETEEHILLYDTCQGFNTRIYKSFYNETSAFRGENKPLTFWGGEFFASNKQNALIFSEKCLEIYNKMQEKSFYTENGDEFIIGVAAAELKSAIKNAGAYIFRFWTGNFYLVSTCYAYNAVAALHVPAEKEKGFIKIFDKYVKKGALPKNHKAHKLLHISQRPFISSLKHHIKTILQKPLYR